MIDLKEQMNLLYKEWATKNIDIKIVIAKAVQLGMNYQEEKIRSGIDIVFQSLKTK